MKRINYKQGFSLIEIMVSLAIFSIVVLVATGALLAVMDANKKTQALKSVVNNLNFALENMARNIRVGKDYHCGQQGTVTSPQDCSNGGDYLAFKASETGYTTVYRWDSSTQSIKKTDNVNSNIICSGTCINDMSLTAPEVQITNMKFYVTGSSAGGEQPKVRLVVSGKMNNSKIKLNTDFNIQTTLTQRVLDF